MKKTPEVTRFKKPSLLKAWFHRSLILLALAKDSGCKHSTYFPKVYGDPSDICWKVKNQEGKEEVIRPEQHPPPSIPLFPLPTNSLRGIQQKYFFAAYIKTSDSVAGKIRFGKKPENEPLLTKEQLHELYEQHCLEGSYNLSEITSSAAQNYASVESEKGVLTIPIAELDCQLFTNSDEEEGRQHKEEVWGLFLKKKNIILAKGELTNYIKNHEGAHVYLRERWSDERIDEYNRTKMPLDTVTTQAERAMTGLAGCYPVSMDMLNEMIADALGNIGAERDKWDLYRARVTLGLNIMERITSVLTYHNQPVTASNYQDFAPFILLKRSSQWLNEPWAEEAALYAANQAPWVALDWIRGFSGKPWPESVKPWLKKVFRQAAHQNLFLVATETPFLIEELGKEFFEGEMQKNQEVLAYIPPKIRRKYWPEKRLTDPELIKALPIELALNNLDLFQRESLNNSQRNVVIPGR